MCGALIAWLSILVVAHLAMGELFMAVVFAAMAIFILAFAEVLFGI